MFTDMSTQQSSLEKRNAILNGKNITLQRQLSKLMNTYSVLRIKYEEVVNNINVSSSDESGKSDMDSSGENNVTNFVSNNEELELCKKKLRSFRVLMKKKIFELSNRKISLQEKLKKRESDFEKLRNSYLSKINTVNKLYIGQKKEYEELQLQAKSSKDEIEGLNKEIQNLHQTIQFIGNESKSFLKERNQCLSRLRSLQQKSSDGGKDGISEDSPDLKIQPNSVQKMKELYVKKLQDFQRKEVEYQKGSQRFNVLSEQLLQTNRRFKIALQKNEYLEIEMKKLRECNRKSLEVIKKREKSVLRKIKNYKTLKVSYLDMKRRNQDLSKALHGKSKSLPKRLENGKEVDFRSLKESIKNHDVTHNGSPSEKEAQLKEFIEQKEKKKMEKTIAALKEKVKSLEGMNRKMHINNILNKNVSGDNSLQTKEGLRKTVFSTREVLKENEERLKELNIIVVEKEKLDKKTKELRGIIIKKEIEIESLKNQLQLKENEIV